MTDKDHVKSASIALPTARIDGGERLVFPNAGDFMQAWDLGIFYLEVPDTLDLDNARAFGRELLDPCSAYRKIARRGVLEGYIALDNNQQTKLALQRENWDRYYPKHIGEFGRQLDAIGVMIMREALRQAGLPESVWERASGGYTSGAGTAFLNFVHYDTRQPHWGLRPHTDYGFVTILDATAPGLQIERDGTFVDVPVRSGHLAIHFGEALKYVTAHTGHQAAAVRHRVLSQQLSDPIRHGIVYFANPDLDGAVWQFDPNGTVMGSSSVASLFSRLEKDLTQSKG